MSTKHDGLRAILDRNRLQQKHVAEALGVTRMTVWSWVDGRNAPSGPNLAALLAYLQQFEPSLTVADLMPAPAVVATEQPVEARG